MTQPAGDGPAPRRAGWVRVGMLVAMGVVCAVIGEYGVAALFGLVAATVWWIDRGIASRRES